MKTLLGSLLAAFGAAGLFIVGCSSSASVDNPFDSGGGGSGAQMAAFAASSEFPSDAEASNDLTAMALVNRSDNTIRILNASDQAIRDAKVWVNGSFVTQLDNLPANGSVTLPRSRFYDRTGTQLSRMQTAVNRVQLESGDNLYNLQGPVFE